MTFSPVFIAIEKVVSIKTDTTLNFYSSSTRVTKPVERKAADYRKNKSDDQTDHHCWNDDRNHWLTGSLQFILNKHGQFSMGGVFGSIDLYPRSLFL